MNTLPKYPQLRSSQLRSSQLRSSTASRVLTPRPSCFYKHGLFKALCLILMILYFFCCMTTISFAADSSSSDAEGFPDTNAPVIYDPDTESGNAGNIVILDDGQVTGDAVINIEDYEKAVQQSEKSNLFDGVLFCVGGIIFFYAVLLVLAYGLDRVSLFPKFSFLSLMTFKKFDIYNISIYEFLLRDMVLIFAGIFFGSGLAKRLIALILMGITNLLK